MAAAAYAELITTSNFSFLRGGSHADELVYQAAGLGLAGLGICDRNSFAGVVCGHVAMRDIKTLAPNFRYVVGVRLVFAGGTPERGQKEKSVFAHGTIKSCLFAPVTQHPACRPRRLFRTTPVSFLALLESSDSVSIIDQ